MKQMQKKGISFALTLILLFSLVVPAGAVSDAALDSAVTDTAGHVYATVKMPQIGSIGGEWAVLGLARSGYAVPESYYQNYYAAVEAYVKACSGQLHAKKYTEYSRVILALSAIGKDARNVAGYDLTKPLGDYDQTIWQGINGPIWALIALDSRDYPMPQNGQAATQATRQMYVDYILDNQLADGGWSLNGENSKSDPDLTGMALQALARYQNQKTVAQAIEKALACMSQMQDEQGGFSSWNTDNSESCVQMIVALCELGISLDDSRFVKNGKTILDGLLTYYQKGAGFLHTKDSAGSNQMASEQGLYALAAVQRAKAGKNTLYRMSDAITISGGSSQNSGAGLSGKHKDVKAVSITAPGTTFDDISTSHAVTAIQALASREIINGKGNGKFEPDVNMTRAEFATIVVKALGLSAKANSQFTDVASSAWYAPYVGTAYTYGIVSGTSATTFNPLGTITRQEAAAMVARAAKLCGLDTALDTVAVRDTLAQFTDYVSVADWARASVAFCYREEILDASDLSIQPKTDIKRGEIAQMLFNLLGKANLL